jgi:glutathione S-transferase
MELIGMLDSPYVRRVAISLELLGIPFEHRSVSVFRDFDRFVAINPVVKAPTLIDDDGTQLIDSTLILDYLDSRVPMAQRLMPEAPTARRDALRVIGFALAATEKLIQQVYERTQRPPERRHEPWAERLRGQMHAAFGIVEGIVAAHGDGWLGNGRVMQADVTVAVAWRCTQCLMPGLVDPARYPALAAFSARAEALPAFLAAPVERD